VTGVSDLIRTDKPLRYGANAVYPHKHLIEKQYRFVSRFGSEVLLHKVVGQEIHLPRALCPVGDHDVRSKGTPATFPVCPVPRPNQVKVFGETLGFLQKGLSGQVVAYTGWGKTVLGYYVAARLGVKTLVVTTKDDIYKQWIGGACGVYGQPNFLGLQRKQVGEIRGDKLKTKNCPFVVAMIHSLSKDGKVPEDTLAEFGLVIFDECHRVPAETFSVVADMLPAYLRMGLSATPTRADGKELLVQAHIGPIRAKTEEQLMVPKVLRFVSSWQCPRVLRTFRNDDGTARKVVMRMPHEAGKTTHIEKIIAADPSRNMLVAQLIHGAYEKGRNTAVFSTLHDHLRALHRCCRELGISGKDMGYYVGATTKAELIERDKAMARKVVFTTFGMMGEGTDIPWIDTCVLAIPRANVAQAVGRIRREYEGKREPVVMDVIDEDSPVFAGYADSRRHWYRSIGCQVLDME
jgi:superfamily II DNA or RNA helicase